MFKMECLSNWQVIFPWGFHPIVELADECHFYDMITKNIISSISIRLFPGPGCCGVASLNEQTYGDEAPNLYDYETGDLDAKNCSHEEHHDTISRD